MLGLTAATKGCGEGAGVVCQGGFSVARACARPCCLRAPAAERVYYFPPAKSVIFLSGLRGSAPTDVTGRESSLRHAGAIARGVGVGG